MKRLSKNIASIFISDIGRRLVGFLSVAYLARTIGTEGFGIVSIGLTVLSYALMISSSGLNTFGIREIAKGGHGNFVGTMVSVRFINALVTLLLVALIAFIGIRDQRISLVIFVTACSVLPAAFHLDWYFQGKEEMHVVSVVRLSSAVVYFLVLLVFVHSPEHLLWVAAASVIGDIVIAGILLKRFQTRERLTPFHLSFGEWKSLMSHAFPLGVGSLLGHFSINLPPLVLGILMTTADVGIYSAGNKLVFFLLMLDRVLATILLPASSRLQAIGADRLASVLEVALKWILLTALPIAVGGTLLAQGITVAIFGSAFEATTVVFQILIWYFVLTMIHTVYTSGVIAVGGETSYGKVMVFSAAIYAVTIVLGTMWLGVVGAAAAIVFSEAVTVLMMRQQLHKTLVLRFPKQTMSIFASAVLMGMAVYLLPNVHLIVSIVAGFLTYTVILFVTRGIRNDDIAYLLERL